MRHFGAACFRRTMLRGNSPYMHRRSECASSWQLDMPGGPRPLHPWPCRRDPSLRSTAFRALSTHSPCVSRVHTDVVRCACWTRYGFWRLSPLPPAFKHPRSGVVGMFGQSLIGPTGILQSGSFSTRSMPVGTLVPATAVPSWHHWPRRFKCFSRHAGFLRAHFSFFVHTQLFCLSHPSRPRGYLFNAPFGVFSVFCVLFTSTHSL